MDDTPQGKLSNEDEIVSRIHALDNPSEDTAVEEKQPEPVPSSDQKPTEETVEEVKTQDQGDDLELPEGVSERTRQQFDKLKARLADAEAKASFQPDEPKQNFGNSVFDVISPTVDTPVAPATVTPNYSHLNQQQIEQVTNQFIDAEGNVDVNGLNRALYDANSKAEQALQMLQQERERRTRFEETQQLKETYKDFPELEPPTPGKPNQKFDPTFYELVRDRLVRNWSEGKNLPLVQVAQDVRKVYQPQTPVDVAAVKEQAVTEYKHSQELRNQGPIEQGSGEPRESAETSLKELREKTRKGDLDAVAERLRGIGVIPK